MKQFLNDNWKALLVMFGIVALFTICASIITAPPEKTKHSLNILNVNGCEYIVYGDYLLHKANCTNSIHSVNH